MASIRMYLLYMFLHTLVEMECGQKNIYFSSWSFELRLPLSCSLSLFCGVRCENFGNRQNLFIVSGNEDAIELLDCRNKQEIQFIVFFLCISPWLFTWCCCCCFWNCFITPIKSNFVFFYPKNVICY